MDIQKLREVAGEALGLTRQPLSLMHPNDQARVMAYRDAFDPPTILALLDRLEEAENMLRLRSEEAKALLEHCQVEGR